MRQLLNTKEVADYLRLKERKIYDLVAQGAIPHSRVSGKLLFPRALVDDWVRQATSDVELKNRRLAPPVIAGSSDPLLEWAIRESRSGLASLTYGSIDGIDRLVNGEACAAALHIPSGGGPRPVDRNAQMARDRLAHLDCVLIEWARREQGLVVAPSNARKIRSLKDLAKPKVRTIVRPNGAGSYLLLMQLLEEAGLSLDALDVVPEVAQTEGDVAAAILDGRADAGLAVHSVARQFRLAFVPLAIERLDIAVLRGSYFDPPWQRLLAFSGTRAFAQYAKSLTGYDATQLGKVHWNA